ncbi:MAG: hypothetical protein WEE67_02985 [Chloroflexota bacterium]
MSRSWRLLTATLLVLTACVPSASSPVPGASGSPPSASVAASGEPSALGSAEATDSETPSGGLPDFVCDLPIIGAASIGLAHLADVRVGTHAGYDRIVFEFMEDGTPEFRIEAADPPFSMDPSGMPMAVNGSAFLQIILNGGTKVGDDGSPTYTGPTEFGPGFDQLVDLIERGDFEAINNWYVGMAGEGCLRAFVLSDPSRIVIDLEH